MLDGLAITEGILMGVICSEHTIATYLAAVTKVLCLILLSADAQGLQNIRAVLSVQGLEILRNLNPPTAFLKLFSFAMPCRGCCLLVACYAFVKNIPSGACF